MCAENSFLPPGTVGLIPDEMSIASGLPEKTVAGVDSVQYPAWSFSGETTGESVVGTVAALPGGCRGVKVEIVVATDLKCGSEREAVFRVYLSQRTGKAELAQEETNGMPVRVPLAANGESTRTIGLESYYAADAELPLKKISGGVEVTIDTAAIPGGPSLYFELSR